MQNFNRKLEFLMGLFFITKNKYNSYTGPISICLSLFLGQLVVFLLTSMFCNRNPNYYKYQFIYFCCYLIICLIFGYIIKKYNQIYVEDLKDRWFEKKHTIDVMIAFQHKKFNKKYCEFLEKHLIIYNQRKEIDKLKPKKNGK